LLVELKMGKGPNVADRVREALQNLLAYEMCFTTALASQDGPVGLGIAWGEGLDPADHRLMLATVDQLDLGLERFLVDAT
jgi:hypothetical protein